MIYRHGLVEISGLTYELKGTTDKPQLLLEGYDKGLYAKTVDNGIVIYQVNRAARGFNYDTITEEIIAISQNYDYHEFNI